VQCIFTTITKAINWLQAHKIKPKQSRSKPLIALPVIGTGMVGFGSSSGLMCSRMLSLFAESVTYLLLVLLTLLTHFVRLHDVDFILVCYEKLKYDAAMKIRKEMGVFFDDKVLSPKLKENVKLLAAQAAAGNLSVFIGAGCVSLD
jgi:hypothetical protein